MTEPRYVETDENGCTIYCRELCRRLKEDEDAQAIRFLELCLKAEYFGRFLGAHILTATEPLTDDSSGS